MAAKAHQLFSIAALLAGGAPSVLVVLREEVQFLQPWKPLLMLPLRKRRAGLLNLARAAKDQQELRVGEHRVFGTHVPAVLSIPFVFLFRARSCQTRFPFPP